MRGCSQCQRGEVPQNAPAQQPPGTARGIRPPPRSPGRGQYVHAARGSLALSTGMNERTYRRRQPLLLPTALTMSGHDTVCAASRLHGLEGIRGGVRRMVGHVSSPRSLACGSRGSSCRPFRRISRGSVRLYARRACHSGTDFPASPRPSHIDRPPRPAVLRILLAEQRQHMLRAVRRPAREQTMSVQVKRAAAMDRLEAFVSHPISLFWPTLGDQTSAVHQRMCYAGIPNRVTAATKSDCGVCPYNSLLALLLGTTASARRV